MSFSLPPASKDNGDDVPIVDPITQRFIEAHQRLVDSLPALSKQIRSEQSQLKTEDIFTMQLHLLTGEANDLEKKVSEFKGPHFTKNYRTLQGDFAKLQMELDGLDSTRNDIREEKKTVINLVDKLAKELAAKAHPDGKSCPDCEVKD